VAGGNDLARVDPIPECTSVLSEEAVEGEPEVARPSNRFLLLHRQLDPVEEGQRIAGPNGAIAADMLQVQARDPS
uniref:hypothetical protein n=1 Tax=Enterobacter cloacae TaxID=550 RepID=UPI0013D489D0